jgi:hypothetical protein
MTKRLLGEADRIGYPADQGDGRQADGMRIARSKSEMRVRNGALRLTLLSRTAVSTSKIH